MSVSLFLLMCFFGALRIGFASGLQKNMFRWALSSLIGIGLPLEWVVGFKV